MWGQWETRLAFLEGADWLVGGGVGNGVLNTREEMDMAGRTPREPDCSQWSIVGTLPETNIAPENGWLELEYSFPFGMPGLFSGASC